MSLIHCCSFETKHKGAQYFSFWGSATQKEKPFCDCCDVSLINNCLYSLFSGSLCFCSMTASPARLSWTNISSGLDVIHSIKRLHQLHLYTIKPLKTPGALFLSEIFSVCVYLQYVHVTGSISNKRLSLFGRHRLGETSTLTKKPENDQTQQINKRRYWVRISASVLTVTMMTPVSVMTFLTRSLKVGSGSGW